MATTLRRAALMGPKLQPLSSVCFSTSNRNDATHSHKLVIVGGGTGGSAVAHSFVDTVGKGQTAVIEPHGFHYYQPMWTLVGGGIKEFHQSERTMKSALPSGAVWYQQKAAKFDPKNNEVHLSNGDVVKYEFLVVASGIKLRYDMIPGLVDALENDPKVCSNYHKKYVVKTFPALQNFKSGNMIFTFPNTPIKCAGAPQKICYIADDYLRREGRRDTATIMYNTSLPVIFGIPRYAAVLNQIVEKRGIVMNKRTNLCEVRHEKNEADFELLDEPGKKVTYNYGVLHASPPCAPAPELSASPLADNTGYVDVNRDTLQHAAYSNVFALGDCTNAPTAKTAAAVSSQSGIVLKNLDNVMNGRKPEAIYDGYTSCPLVTGRNKCILAEFGYDGAILETFPINQAKERASMYYFKTEIFPRMYWWMLITGWWQGPSLFRKILNLGVPAK